MSNTYTTRSGAVRAARRKCKKLLGPFYQAFEGPDYYIHPSTDDRFYFELSPVVVAEALQRDALKVLSVTEVA